MCELITLVFIGSSSLFFLLLLILFHGFFELLMGNFLNFLYYFPILEDVCKRCSFLFSLLGPYCLGSSGIFLLNITIFFLFFYFECRY